VSPIRRLTRKLRRRSPPLLLSRLLLSQPILASTLHRLSHGAQVAAESEIRTKVARSMFAAILRDTILRIVPQDEGGGCCDDSRPRLAFNTSHSATLRREPMRQRYRRATKTMPICHGD